MLGDLRSRIDYGLRQRLRLSPARWLLRRGVRLRAEDKTDLFAGRAEPARREAALRESFGLDDLRARTDRRNYLENLYYLELAQRAMVLGSEAGWRPPTALVAADIGVSHWFYVQALLAALRHAGTDQARQVALTGYEADPWRLHADLFTRADHAEAHMAGEPSLTFVPHAFAARCGDCHWVSLFFPFVFAADHRRWGLPGRLHQPAELLAAAWASLAPGGLLVIVNQGDAELSAQQALLAEAGLPAGRSEPFESGFYQYSIPRRLTVVCRS